MPDDFIDSDKFLCPSTITSTSSKALTRSEYITCESSGKDSIIADKLAPMNNVGSTPGSYIFTWTPCSFNFTAKASKGLSLKFIPKLRFKADEIIKQIEKTNKIFEEIDKKHST